MNNISLKEILIVLFILGLLLFASFLNDNGMPVDVIQINSFFDCIEAGNPAMESYPRQCRTADGKTFVEDIGNEMEKIDFIRINSPRPNQVIENPFAIEGEARGVWFFEGDFPVRVLDGNQNIIGSGFVSTQENWMTEDFVGFEGEVSFESPETRDGTVILEKDNPSDLVENDDRLIIHIFFY